MSSPRITCVFHSSPSIALLLNAPVGRPLAGDLLVECAPLPSLSLALSLETPITYPGIAGLLGGADVESLANSSEKLPAPVVLAPGAACTPNATRAALLLLQRPDERIDHITLIVPVGYASALGSALSVATEFTLAWDVSEFPHEELLEFARWLARERLIDRASFHGVIAYASQPVDATHTQRITTVLGPLATASHAPTVVSLAS